MNPLSPSVHAAKINTDFIFRKLEEDRGSIKHAYYCHTLCWSLQDYCTVGVLQGCLGRRILAQLPPTHSNSLVSAVKCRSFTVTVRVQRRTQARILCRILLGLVSDPKR